MLTLMAELMSQVYGIKAHYYKRYKIDDALPNGAIAPYVFVGDDAFALKKFMMKPYPQQNLTADKRVYNYRHSRAKRISENLFGILANR